jgi:hypothetical protein
LPAAVPEDLPALRRAFEAARADATDFNAEYQELYDTVAVTPQDQERRRERLVEHTNRFLAHAQVPMPVHK